MTFSSHASSASEIRESLRGRLSIRLAMAIAFAAAVIGSWFAIETNRHRDAHSVLASAPAWRTVVDADAIRAALEAGHGRAAAIVVLEAPDGVGDFRSWTNAEAVRRHRERVDATITTFLGGLPTDTVIRQRFTNFPGVSLEASRETFARLARDPGVATIEPVRRLEAHTIQGLSLIGANAAHASDNRGAGLSIAIVDTGIDSSHAQLGGSENKTVGSTNATNQVILGGADFVDPSRRPIDLDGHGTRVAGITAGRPSADGNFAGGAAPAASLYALKIADTIEDGAASDALVAAWDWALTHRDDDPARPIVVVNTSFGLDDTGARGDGFSPAATRAAAMLVDAGIVPVASAGNAGNTDAIAWPASISHVIGVGAVYDEPLPALRFCLDPDGGRDLSGHAPHGDGCDHACEDSAPAPDQVPCYSNSSSAISLLAPSHDAYTLDENGGFTCCFGGTSVSSAYVAGSIALVQAAWRERTGTLLSPTDLRARLERTGAPITDAKSGITTPRLDVARAIEAIAPENDDCSHATPVVDGRFSFSTFGATTDPTDEPSALAPIAVDAIGADVWFCYNAPTTGFAELSLCGSSFDTRVAIYAGCDCPDGDPLAFNDDFCGPQSEIVFPITEGEYYLIRVGGFENAQGDGLFELRSGDGADLVLDKTIDKEQARPGDAVAYRVLVRNDGPSRATGITIVERMPEDLEIVEAFASVGVFDTKNGAWDIAALDVNASAMLTIHARVIDEPKAFVAVNFARITALDQIDPDPENDEDGEPLDIAGVTADLAVTKVVDNATPNEGDTITYTVTLTNNGPDNATGVQVTDLLPTGVTYVSDSPSQGTYTAGTGVWDVGALANTASATLGITATVDAGTAGTTIINSASVTALDQTDPTPGDDSDTASLTVRSADLAVTKVVDDPAPAEGGTITYTVTLTNNGPDDATGTAVLDNLPTGVTYVSDTPSQGSYDDATGAWIVGGLTNGSSATLTITATVDAGTAGTTITNTASRANGNPVDPNTANDSDSAPITVASADLAVTKTVNDPAPDEGDTIVYTVTLANNGPSDATGTAVLDLLPAGVTYVSDVPSQGTYDDMTGAWIVGGLTNGSSATLMITATVDAGTAGTTITNTASRASGNPTDTNSANDSDSAPITVASADISVTKGVDDANPDEGGTIVYTVTVTNNGPDDATGVQVTDLLPTGVTYVSDTPSQGTYTSGTGLWDIGALTNAASATLSITATVDAGTSGTTITNTATRTASSPVDPNAANDSDSAPIDVAGDADLAMAKIVDDATPDEGDTVLFTVTLTNNGPVDATGVQVTDLLPTGLTYVSDTPSQGSYTPGTGVWVVGSVANAANATLAITATVDAGTAGTTITNTASVTALDQTDPTPGNDSASAGITVQSADLAIAKVVDDPTPGEGDTIAYTVTATNNGPLDATGVQVTDLLPAGVTYASDTPSQGTYTPGTGLWDIGALNNGVSATLMITATVDAGTSGDTITNTATRTASSPADSNAANDTASADIVVAAADIAVTKVVDIPTPDEGQAIEFTVTVTNDGPENATGIVVNDLLPSGLTFVSATVSQGTYTPGTGVWDIGALTNGSNATLTLDATVDAGTAGQTIVNTATRTASEPDDPNPANDTDAASVTVVSADLGVTKIVDVPSPNVGDTVTFTVTLVNNGPDNATGVQVTDLLPTELTLVSATPSVGTYTPGTGVWNVGALANAANETLVIVATVDAGTAGQTITNTATITAVIEGDPVAGNDTASASVTVQGADLGIQKLVDDSTPDEGQTVNFTLILTNGGPDAATNVAVTDLLPSGLTFSSATPSQGTYTPGTGVWAIGTLASGNVATLALAATVDAGTAGQLITNAAAITAADQEDPNAGNDSASVNLVVRSADLAIAKVVDDPIVTEGQMITFTLTVSNGGPDNATGVAVLDLLPAGLTFVSANPSQGSYDPMTGAWVVGGLANGAIATLGITVTVDVGTQGSTITNTASIANGNPVDPNPANDVASQDVIVPLPLANDDCVDAIAVSEGTTPFNNLGATTDGPDEPGLCNFLGDTQVQSDVWFVYTPSCTGQATVSLCGSGYDTKMAIYDGAMCPTVASAIACNEDFCSRQSQITFSAVTGTPYLIRIGGFLGEQGTGTMEITCVPENDNCINATPVGDGTFAFGNVGATTDGPDEPLLCDENGETQVESDVWYLYTASCDGSATVSLCGSAFNTKIAVYDGNVCPTVASAIACNDDFCATESQVSFPVMAGGAYLLRIGGFMGDQGVGTATITCSPVALNDDCEDAFPVSDGVTPFDNIGATTDGPDEPGICNLLGDTQVRSDVWFEYVATCTGEVTVSLCGSSFDTKLAIYAGAACPTMESAIACSEDFCGRQSQVTFTGTLGNTYLIRIGGFGGEQGTGLLDISCNPSNDNCANAIPVTDGVIPFSNVGATTDGPDEPGECDFLGDTQVQADVWYRYTATCSGEATVSLCGSSYDTKIAIYNGAVCPTVESAVACNEDSCGRQSEVTFLVLQGQQYLIRIGGFQGEQGDGVMDISCRPAPPSDNCVNAIQVFEGTFAFDTFDATTDGPDEPGSCDFLGYTHIESDIWYEYTPTCTGEITISLCGSGYDTKMAVYDGFVCPPTEAPIACNDDTCECGGAGCTLDSLVTFMAIAGQSYLVRIGGFEGEQGAGTMTISCDPIPLNDRCPDAIYVGEGVFPFDNIGATTDGPDEPSLCLSGGESQVRSDVWFVYEAGCNGTATISLCGSNFDTRMAIYNGASCPVGESAIACNDDFCNRQSEITLSVIAGRQYLVRIGGFEGEQGEGTLTITCDGVPIGQCQGQDADVDVIRVNGTTGQGAGFVVPVSFAGPITLEIDGPPAGPGKFVVHMNVGVPDAGTIIALPFGLGSSCFDFLITRNGMPVSVWNNIGKTSKVGASNYFGTMIPNPNNAPTIFESQPTGDPVNLPIGSTFTLQGLITNLESSSPRNVSITNAVIMNVQ